MTAGPRTISETVYGSAITEADHAVMQGVGVAALFGADDLRVRAVGSMWSPRVSWLP